VTKLIVAVNKMDEPSITGPGGVWSEERYNEIMVRVRAGVGVMMRVRVAGRVHHRAGRRLVRGALQ